jgi:hypothetical protein
MRERPFYQHSPFIIFKIVVTKMPCSIIPTANPTARSAQ